jgi:hypothetical protein
MNTLVYSVFLIILIVMVNTPLLTQKNRPGSLICFLTTLFYRFHLVLSQHFFPYAEASNHS